ncbi:MAG: ATP-binding cassette domain-containing protein [Alphaproteobacteria bacterium]|nr:ATP-binding cassette domain-containing protein [Alphaproteobacteria bacterium]
MKFHIISIIKRLSFLGVKSIKSKIKQTKRAYRASIKFFTKPKNKTQKKKENITSFELNQKIKNLYHTFQRRFIWKKIQRTPTILQMEATECGSICFSIILEYYGHELTPEEARNACGVSRDGSKASHIMRAARLYNMSAKAYSVKNISLLETFDRPFIIHWNFDHFVVFEGRKGKYYYINDPALGRRRVDFSEFNNMFTGVILVLKPEQNFARKKLPDILLNFLTFSLKNEKSSILFAFLLSILQVFPTLLIGFSGKIFVDYVLIKSMSYWLIPLTLILLGVIVFQSIALTLHQRLLVRLGMHFKLALESLLVHKLFYLPLRFFDQRYSGDILSRLAATDELSNLLSLEIMGALSNIFGLILFAIVLSMLSMQIFLVVLIFVLFRIAVFYVFRKPIREANIQFQQENGKVAGIEMNGLQLIDTLKANNLEHNFFKTWAAHHDVLLNKQQAVGTIEQYTNVCLTGLATLMVVALLYRGSYLVMGEDITIGTLVAFLVLVNYLDTPLMTLLDFSTKLEKVKASITRFNDILLQKTLHEIKSDSSSKSKTPSLPPLKEKITLENITFSYAPFDPPLFKDLNLVIPKGKRIAIAGISGSGKSSISKIICGLYPILSGKILWDSKPIQDMHSALRSSRISLVDQDIYLFEGTIRENLTTWDKNISDKTLIDALKLSGLYEELSPRGLLNCIVRENGANLSGGQRQRLEIARALIRNTDVLILDEATSALDVQNETALFKALSKLKITIIIIAHRLATIQNADKIFVIDQGKVIQSGKHDKLIVKTGTYKNLVELEWQDSLDIKKYSKGDEVME